jgi:hypothetical protein
MSQGAMTGSTLRTIIGKQNVMKLCRNLIVKALTLLLEFPILAGLDFWLLTSLFTFVD